jgi:hypothetical protein
MPYHEPDSTDPLELCGVRAGEATSEETGFLVQCLTQEYLRMGFSPQDVLALFRSPQYPLAHRAWLELGEVAVFTLVQDVASARRRARPDHAEEGAHA